MTENTMIFAIGALRGETSWGDLEAVWSWSWLGNLTGSALVVGLAAGAAFFATDTAAIT